MTKPKPKPERTVDAVRAAIGHEDAKRPDFSSGTPYLFAFGLLVPIT